MTFATLTLLYGQLNGTATGDALIEWTTVRPAAMALGWLPIDTIVEPAGTQLKSARISLNVRHGCDGADVFFLVIAALVAEALHWTRRAIGVLVGLAIVLGLNVARVVVLFVAFEYTPAWFGPLHGLILPLAVVGATAGWFLWFVRGNSADVHLTARPLGA